MSKDLDTITGYNWGRSHIQLELGKFAYELRPIEVHLKEDGCINDTPSMCIVMTNETGTSFIYGQLSLEMWNKALNEIGYKITPNEQHEKS